METNCDYIKLQFDDFEMVFHRAFGIFRETGWTVFRGAECVVRFVSWEKAFDSLTTAERVRCIAFANQMH